MSTPANESAGADMVVRRGKIFECGEFPDKQFTMSPDELRTAADGFSGPLPIDLEHIPTVLDGKLGRVDSVWVSDDGLELHGSVSLPSWLDGLLKDGERKVSATWNRATKGLEKLAIVRSPRVKDAVLFAAFSAAHPEEVEATFATPRKKHDHATAHHQLIHDAIAVGYPGVCSGGKVTPPMDMAGMSEADAVYFTDHPQQLKSLRSIHAMTVQNGAVCSGKAQMSESDISSRSNAMSDENKKVEKVEKTVDVVPFSETQEYKDLLARVAAAEKLASDEKKKNEDTLVKFAEAEKAIEANRVKQVEADSKAFASGLIKDKRAFSVEFSALVSDYIEAANSDAKAPELVTFSFVEGQTDTGTRVDRLKARHAIRPQHNLFDPALGDGELLHDGERVLFHTKPAKNDPASVEAERTELLSKTPAGLATLAREAASKKGN